jgi:hypothetical protein
MPDEVIAALSRSGGASAAAVFLSAGVLQHLSCNRMISLPRLHLGHHGEQRGKAAPLMGAAGVP